VVSDIIVNNNQTITQIEHTTSLHVHLQLVLSYFCPSYHPSMQQCAGVTQCYFRINTKKSHELFGIGSSNFFFVCL